MATLNRLVAATDLSAPARHAVERAASVSQATGAQLDLVHVATPAPIERLRRLAGQIPSDLEKRMLDAPHNAMQELAKALARRHGVTAQVHVASGSLLAELRQHTETINADLVVLGARGASFMRHMLLGSTADRMVSRATRPMLVVKQAPHEPYKTVLVPVDFSAASLRSIRLAQAVAPGASAKRSALACEPRSLARMRCPRNTATMPMATSMPPSAGCTPCMPKAWSMPWMHSASASALPPRRRGACSRPRVRLHCR